MRRVFPASCCCFVKACFLLSLLSKRESVNDSDVIPAETHGTVCECLRSFCKITNVKVFSIECSNLWASTIFTQCNAVIIIIIQLLIIFFFFFFVFVQNKCVKISEENVSFLIL